jgi:hypothetical protein
VSALGRVLCNIVDSYQPVVYKVIMKYRKLGNTVLIGARKTEQVEQVFEAEELDVDFVPLPTELKSD